VALRNAGGRDSREQNLGAVLRPRLLGEASASVAGKHMFSEDHPGHGELSMTACVRKSATEPAQWLYAQHPIRIEVVPERKPNPPQQA
jgi:hypothetical protein